MLKLGKSNTFFITVNKKMTTDSVPSIAYAEPPELDHIVHLVSPGKLGESVEQYKQLGFSVERGGVHADGLTQNALIILTDGVYIELIEFLEKPLKGYTNENETLNEWKQRRSKHWWWDRKVGWIDWCLRGGKQDARVETINKVSNQIEADREKASKKEKTENSEKQMIPQEEEKSSPLVRYNNSQQGGRRALSGKEIRWNVTFPALFKDIQRGTFPFWCEDITPRWWRVPTPSPPHPNLTRGLSALTLLYYPENFPSRLASLQLILSSKQVAQQGFSQIASTIVDTRPPPKTEGRTALPDSFVELYLATPEGPLLPIRIKAADDPAEVEWLETYGEGLFEVEISVAAEKLPSTAPPDGIERESAKLGYGRLRLHPMRVNIPP